jgi:predicted permease
VCHGGGIIYSRRGIGGDEALAASCVVVSTALSILSISAVVALD